LRSLVFLPHKFQWAIVRMSSWLSRIEIEGG